MLEILPIPAVVMDREGRYVFLNRACADDPVLAQGLHNGHGRHAEMQQLDPQRYAHYVQALKTRKPVSWEETVEDGGRRVLWLYTPVLGQEGTVTEVLIIGVDVSAVHRRATAVYRQNLAELIKRELQVPLTVLVGLANSLAQELTGIHAEHAAQIGLNGQLLLRQLRTLHLSIPISQSR